jgi:ABC-type amino acid transport substrate-binding protein
MKINAGLIVFFSFVLFLIPSPLSANLQVTVGVYQNKPLIFVDGDGTTRGIYADVLEYVASKEGWSVRYLPGSFQQGLDRLKSGEIDVLCTIAYSKERDSWCDFTNENLLTNWGQIYTPKNSKIRTIVDLDNKKVYLRFVIKYLWASKVSRRKRPSGITRSSIAIFLKMPKN